MFKTSFVKSTDLYLGLPRHKVCLVAALTPLGKKIEVITFYLQLFVLVPGTPELHLMLNYKIYSYSITHISQSLLLQVPVIMILILLLLLLPLASFSATVL